MLRQKLFRMGLLIAGLTAVFLLSPQATAAKEAAVTIKDSLGRSVQVPNPVRRIVALNSDVLEIVRTLKAEEYVVGVFSEIVREPEFWGGLAEKPKVGSWRDPDLEAIAMLAPDVVVAYGRNPGPTLEQKANLLRIQVLRLDFYKLSKIEEEVRAFGLLLDRRREAEHFCEWHRRYLKMIQERVARTSHRPKVYIESYSDYHAAGPGSGGDEICMLAGGTNIAASLSIPFPRVTPEWVLAKNPEAIIKAASYGDGYRLKNAMPLNQRRDAILRRPTWHHIPAVISGNVHVMDSSIWTGPRAIIGVGHMVQWIHPALFSDLAPETLHRMYLETFQGVPYRGVFVSDDASRWRE
jgi:iron complex transport system substrate-binding protein